MSYCGFDMHGVARIEDESPAIRGGNERCHKYVVRKIVLISDSGQKAEIVIYASHAEELNNQSTLLTNTERKLTAALAQIIKAYESNNSDSLHSAVDSARDLIVPATAVN